jgi:hypothetical protein
MDNIKMDLRQIGWDDVDWIALAQGMEKWMTLVNKVMNFGFHKMLGTSLIAAQLAASQEGLSSMKLV